MQGRELQQRGLCVRAGWFAAAHVPTCSFLGQELDIDGRRVHQETSRAGPAILLFCQHAWQSGTYSRGFRVLGCRVWGSEGITDPARTHCYSNCRSSLQVSRCHLTPAQHLTRNNAVSILGQQGYSQTCAAKLLLFMIAF